MENRKILDELIKKLDFMENLYDAIRLVDPVHKEVYSYLKSNSKLPQSTKDACFTFWDRSKVCENCISMRAYNQKHTVVKIEYKSGKIFMVTAVPISRKANPTAVIELIKDITDSGIINVEGMESTELQKLISQRNSQIIKDAFTRINNKQFIFERLPHDILVSRAKGISIGLFLIKVVNVESINNIYGQSIGERVIKEIAKTINQISRYRGDWASSYEKTDFVLVLHNLDENKANRICKRIQGKINQLEFTFGPKKIEIEINIGYYIVGKENLTPEQIIENTRKGLSHSGTPVSENPNVRKYNEFFNKFILSEREKEVALWLVKGNSNIEIAEKIFVGLSTVKKHISSILTKTNLKSRTEFISMLTFNDNK